MKKIILFFTSVTLFVFLVGCDKSDSNIDITSADIEKIVIFHCNLDTGEVDEPPLITITNSEGVSAFLNMINHAKTMSGALDVAIPPYIAEIYAQGDIVYKFSLYISENNGEAMYINHSNTHTGYTIRNKDVNAFLEIYREML